MSPAAPLATCAYCGAQISFIPLGSISHSRLHYYWDCPECGINRQSYTQFNSLGEAIADANRRAPVPQAPAPAPLQSWQGEMRKHPDRIWSYGGFVHETDPREKNRAITDACVYVRYDLVPTPTYPESTK